MSRGVGSCHITPYAYSHWGIEPNNLLKVGPPKLLTGCKPDAYRWIVINLLDDQDRV